MSEDNCAVYVHINLINGKKYFGITIQEPEMRWKNGKGYSNNDHFTNAINKYGWNNFAHYVLYRNIPIKIAKNIEEMLILEHMSYDQRFGYNRTYGGELEIPTEEARQKMSEAKKGRKVSEETRRKLSEANKGKTLSKETRIKLSEAHKGKTLSEETRKKIAIAKTGDKNSSKRPEVREKISKNNYWNGKSGADNPFSKDVLCIDTGIIYHGIHEADRITGINFRNISSVCLGSRKTAGGFHWRYINEEVDCDGNY